MLEITYSYWDGSGHRRTIEVPKGTTIGKFLEWVRQDLVTEFPELRSVSSDNLLYIKEDLIIPQVRSCCRSFAHMSASCWPGSTTSQCG